MNAEYIYDIDRAAFEETVLACEEQDAEKEAE